MVRNYVKKKVAKYSKEDLSQAIDAVKNGNSIAQAAAQFNIPYETLRRYALIFMILRNILQLDVCLKSVFIFRLSSKTSLPEHGGRFRTVLPINLEKQLVEYVEEMSRRFYGLGTKDIRKLCYELAVQNNCDVPETWYVNKSAGPD